MKANKEKGTSVGFSKVTPESYDGKRFEGNSDEMGQWDGEIKFIGLWINVSDELPKIDVNDKWNKEHQLSERVVVWLQDTESANFAIYNHLIKHWSVEGYSGFEQDRVKFFMYINSPYKK